MTLGFKAARGVDGNSSTEREFAALGCGAAFAERNKTEIFNLKNLAHGRCVMNFSDMHVVWSQTGLLVGLIRRESPDIQLRLIETAMAEAADHAGSDFDATAFIRTNPLESVLGAKDCGGSAIRQWSTHR